MNGLSRRAVLRASALAGVVGAMPVRAAPAPPAARLRWIDDAPPEAHEGQAFGVPWPRGTVARGTSFAARCDAGMPLPLQTWPLAFWPDGSIKWTGHALPAHEGAVPSGVRIAPGRATAPAAPVRVAQAADAIRVQVGATQWTIARTGTALIRTVERGGRVLMRDVGLVARAQDAASASERATLTTRRYDGTIESVAIEQDGPVRATIRIEGRHADADRHWLPFVVRLYFTAGSDAVRVVHSFVWDGDAQRDFLTGLGVSADVPLDGAALHDRHVRFATGTGIWGEAVRPLTGLRRDPGAAFRAAQVAGRATPLIDDIAAAVRPLLERIPAWGQFRLTQPVADGFVLTKRTAAGQAPVQAIEGARARGLAYLGSPTGGAAIGLRYFWQRHPAQLDVEDATGPVGRLTAWLWSPEAPAMDMRSYRGALGMDSYEVQNQGLDITYEDYEPGYDSAYGVARTSELWLWALPATPDAARLDRMADTVDTPPQLMVEPARIRAADVLGSWNVPDRSTPLRTAIEDRNDATLAFYRDEIERRRWYGFWNHGDVMHSYDADRHQWRYDIGGYAWDNSELSTDLWLWYSALRSGRGDVFRMAEAMTRHTGEVDVYHLGPWAGLGTRHGVQHWSDSSKQPRIATAANRRIFYYLSTDERTGDLMRALLRSDATLTRVDIGRKVGKRAPDSLPPGGVGAVVATSPLHAGQIQLGFGTSWGSLVAAWFTEWERTGDKTWRDRILAGMDSIARLPKGWWAGGATYDLASGRFTGGGEAISVSHLNAVFGIVETMAELLPLLRVPAYERAWLDYCAWYNAPAAAWRDRFGEPPRGHNLTVGHSRLTAYAAYRLYDKRLAARAWSEFLGGGISPLTIRTIDGAAVPGPVVEIASISTNDAAQWGLSAIQNLALLPD